MSRRISRSRFAAAVRRLVALASLVLTASPAAAQLQEVFTPSNNTWTVTNAAGNVVGPAAYVCLAPDLPTNCPAGATSWLSLAGNAAWFYNYPAIPNGRWIWAPGLSSSSNSVNARYTFTKTFQLTGPPRSGKFFVTADDFAQVRVNGTLVGQMGSTTTWGPRPLTQFDILPYLRQGANTIAVTAQNGVTRFACAGCNTYELNPAGVIFGGRLTSGTGTVLPPGAPTNVQASVAVSIVDVTWGAPATGGAPTDYVVLARTTPGGPIVAALGRGEELGLRVTAPNGFFYLTVRAENSGGAGPESAAVQIQVPNGVAPPGPPSNLQVSVTGSTAFFGWNAPNSGGPVFTYRLLAGTAPGVTNIGSIPGLPDTPRSFGLTDIPPGTYYARLVAENPAGTSTVSNEVTVTVAAPPPPAPPGAPLFNPPTVNGNRDVTLTWTPGPGGAPTGYVLLASSTPGGAPFIQVPFGPETSTVIPNVTPGTFYLRLVATNALGSSAPSNEVTLVVP